MGLMDKIKNLFTEEVEEEIEETEVTEEPIKKEMIQVEIPSPAKKKEIEIPVEEEIEKPKVEEKKEEFKFPFFDDEDFKEIEKEKEKPKEQKRPRLHRKEPKEVYSPPKIEEKKIFKPTPIISPVYGILDKNYQKEDIKTKNFKPRSYYNPKEATLDEIRNKAYGTLEEELETTLFGKNRLLFDDFKEETNEKIEEIEETKEEKQIPVEKEETNDLIGERPRHSAEEESDLTDLIQEEMSKKDKEKPHKISDSELFDMIDSMYQKGDK